MLPAISPLGMIGRISGWGWGIGYAGGLACLVVVLVGFIQPAVPWFGIGRDAAANVRATSVVAALWFAVFAVPLFLLTPDQPGTGISWVRAARNGLAALKATAREVVRHRDLLRFLIASALYLDGLVTLFAFGGIYAAGTFHMSTEEIIQFAIALNVTAGLGAALFGGIDDRLGPKRTIVIALVGLIALGLPLVLVAGKAWFWGLALGLGALVGPAQAAGRSWVARLAPPGMTAQIFGFYTLTGRATAFLGPLVLGIATQVFDSQRAGMATILVFWAVGLVLILGVRDRA
jgi:UMF1 family MFS transporter